MYFEQVLAFHNRHSDFTHLPAAIQVYHAKWLPLCMLGNS